MHGYCLHNLPARGVENAIVFLYIHATLCNVFTQYVVHMVFALSVLLMEMYAEIALPS